VVLVFAAAEILASDWSNLPGWLFGGLRDRLAGYASRDSVDLQSLAGRVVFLRCDPDPVRSSSSYVLVTQSARQSEDLYVVIDR
jgi:hypothetical protein